MHGKGLSSVCKIFITNFRHFQGGAPDLLLIRGYRKMKREGSNDACGCFQRNNNSYFEFIDFDDWLGVGWERCGGRISTDRNYMEEDLTLPIKPFANSKTIYNDPSTMLESKALLSWMEDSKSNTTSFDGKSNNNSIISNHVHDLTGPHEEVDPVTHPMLIDLDISEVEDEIPSAPAVRFSKFVYNGADISNPCKICHEKESILQDHENPFAWTHSDWIFEALFVEVKGPSDRLAERQAIWLHALDVGGGVPAVVCQIREGRNGQQTGHHESSMF